MNAKVKERLIRTVVFSAGVLFIMGFIYADGPGSAMYLILGGMLVVLSLPLDEHHNSDEPVKEWDDFAEEDKEWHHDLEREFEAIDLRTILSEEELAMLDAQTYLEGLGFDAVIGDPIEMAEKCKALQANHDKEVEEFLEPEVVSLEELTDEDCLIDQDFDEEND